MEYENEIAAAIQGAGKSISYQLEQLGNGGAATPMGAIEAHGLAVKEVADAISGQGEERQRAAEEISGGLHAVADAICELAKAVRERS